MIQLYFDCISRSKSTFSSLSAHIQDITPAAKPQRTGLNSRFDRMMDTVNITYRSPARRDRTRSAGSSSNSSYMMPTTPLDAYDTLQSRRLGKDFAVIKMKQRLVSQGEGEREDASTLYPENSTNHRSAEILPGWLSDAFLSLHETHPLRLLLPSSTEQPLVVMSSGLTEPNGHDTISLCDEESPFAFSALEVERVEPHATTFSYSDGPTVSPKLSQINDIHSLSFIPFTRPGPASQVSFLHPSSFVARTQTPSPTPLKQHPSMCHHDFPLSAELCDNFTVICHTSQPAEDMVSTPEHAHIRNPPASASQLSHNSLASPYSQHMPAPCSDIPIADYCKSSDDIKQDEAPISDVYLHGREGIDMSRFQNIFSTPGPGYLVSRPVYFDPPAEGPDSSSVPAFEINYDMECAELDFQWRPYDRSGTTELPQTFYVPSESPTVHLNHGGDNADKLTQALSYPITSTP
ncbi:uncharacterized protein BT62DRAFT_591263 [Guyanagaster necrorhizus]|uniref:Uncharacterized protein n=1 Tax=Guyanagaster necrorhizus TaxID=856835 RepID=A0A9P7VXU8_9AGAR|nr:uncharacterized protein BT62DRAFT_591263 [Guyanagaster necrorhizus MCA 3950]KAG7449551.1 hypothetical protein BT62DRAFT_591263 [Guyanagaster necrorhizus MCA 3950]